MKKMHTFHDIPIFLDAPVQVCSRVYYKKLLLNHTTILKWGRGPTAIKMSATSKRLCAAMFIFLRLSVCDVLFFLFVPGMPSISWCRVASPTAS